ncbi:MBOAT family O-acyltransferase [Acidovorax facilis]|uniref:MBOAT family O-acyltransferase n=1 Tax=Acidovorax facilis TaxID=12917 RepID=UPI003CF442F4
MQHVFAGFLAPYLLAIACFPQLSHRGKVSYARSGLLLGGWLLIVLSPWLIPAEESLARFLAAMGATLIAAKVIDACLDQRRKAPPTWKEFLTFLTNPFALVRRCLPLERPVPAHTNLLRLVLGSMGCAMGIALLNGLFRVDWQRWPFLLEHTSKVTALMVAIVSGLSAATALWRWSGGAAREYMDHPFAARTPADFWRRYNRNMQQFFWEDIFKPLRGHRTPVRTTLLVFGVSALLHELIFYAAIGRVQGYQTVFFALHGVASAMTLRVRARNVWAAIPWISATLAFNLTSSVLFFASIHQVTPFYARGLPEWLQGW